MDNNLIGKPGDLNGKKTPDHGEIEKLFGDTFTPKQVAELFAFAKELKTKITGDADLKALKAAEERDVGGIAPTYAGEPTNSSTADQVVSDGTTFLSPDQVKFLEEKKAAMDNTIASGIAVTLPLINAVLAAAVSEPTYPSDGEKKVIESAARVMLNNNPSLGKNVIHDATEGKMTQDEVIVRGTAETMPLISDVGAVPAIISADVLNQVGQAAPLTEPKPIEVTDREAFLPMNNNNYNKRGFLKGKDRSRLVEDSEGVYIRLSEKHAIQLELEKLFIKEKSRQVAEQAKSKSNEKARAFFSNLGSTLLKPLKWFVEPHKALKKDSDFSFSEWAKASIKALIVKPASALISAAATLSSSSVRTFDRMDNIYDAKIRQIEETRRENAIALRFDALVEHANRLNAQGNQLVYLVDNDIDGYVDNINAKIDSFEGEDALKKEVTDDRITKHAKIVAKIINEKLDKLNLERKNALEQNRKEQEEDRQLIKEACLKNSAILRAREEAKGEKGVYNKLKAIATELFTIKRVLRIGGAAVAAFALATAVYDQAGKNRNANVETVDTPTSSTSANTTTTSATVPNNELPPVQTTNFEKPKVDQNAIAAIPAKVKPAAKTVAAVRPVVAHSAAKAKVVTHIPEKTAANDKKTDITDKLTAEQKIMAEKLVEGTEKAGAAIASVIAKAANKTQSLFPNAEKIVKENEQARKLSEQKANEEAQKLAEKKTGVKQIDKSTKSEKPHEVENEGLKLARNKLFIDTDQMVKQARSLLKNKTKFVIAYEKITILDSTKSTLYRNIPVDLAAYEHEYNAYLHEITQASIEQKNLSSDRLNAIMQRMKWLHDQMLFVKGYLATHSDFKGITFSK